MDENSLRTLMHASEPPPGNVDAVMLVEAGRRSVRRRRFATAIAAGGLTAIVLVGVAGAVALTRNESNRAPAANASPTASAPPGPNANAAPACSIQQLASPQRGLSPSVTAVDPSGRYVAAISAIRDQQGDPVLWTDGVPSLVHLPTAITKFTFNVSGVNSRGDLLINVGAKATSPWLYHNGIATMLPKYAGFALMIGTDINARGDVVGYAETSDSGAFVPLIWPAGHPGEVHKLATPHGANAMAQSIDDAGTVGGSLGDGGTPYVWNASGKGHALKVPPGYHGGRVFSVNGEWAVGWVGVGKQGQVVAARWNLRTGAANVYPDQDEALAA